METKPFIRQRRADHSLPDSSEKLFLIITPRFSPPIPYSFEIPNHDFIFLQPLYSRLAVSKKA